jgi:hypothetical protein
MDNDNCKKEIDMDKIITGIQHIGIPTNDIETPFGFMKRH